MNIALIELDLKGITKEMVMDEMFFMMGRGVDPMKMEGKDNDYVRLCRRGRPFALNRRNRVQILEAIQRMAKVASDNAEVRSAK